MPMLCSHTHCQAAPANAKTQACQRVCLPQRTDRNRKRNNEGTTMVIRKAGFGAKLKVNGL